MMDDVAAIVAVFKTCCYSGVMILLEMRLEDLSFALETWIFLVALPPAATEKFEFPELEWCLRSEHKGHRSSPRLVSPSMSYTTALLDINIEALITWILSQREQLISSPSSPPFLL